MDINDILDSLVSKPPSPEESLRELELMMDQIEKYWDNDDKDSKAARAFVTSMRVWFLYMKENRNHDEGVLINAALTEILGPWMMQGQQTMREFIKLGVLRRDAIMAAAGENPSPGAR